MKVAAQFTFRSFPKVGHTLKNPGFRLQGLPDSQGPLERAILYVYIIYISIVWEIFVVWCPDFLLHISVGKKANDNQSVFRRLL